MIICYDNSRYLTDFSSFVSWYGEIAQLVEQWPEEPRVLGSIPSLATMLPKSVFANLLNQAKLFDKLRGR